MKTPIGPEIAASVPMSSCQLYSVILEGIVLFFLRALFFRCPLSPVSPPLLLPPLSQGSLTS